MTLFLSASDAKDLLSVEETIRSIEEIHADLADGLAAQPANESLAAATGDAKIVPMTGISHRHNLAVVKFMSDIPDNRDRGLPTQRSMILATSTTTGECLAVIDGQIPTRERTAAASAVATKYLARQSGSTLGLVGAGNLAIAHVAYLTAVVPIDRIIVWSRSAATAAHFRSQVATHGIPVFDAQVPQDVIEQADIVCTLTPSEKPIIQGEWLQPGQHINAVGAPPRPDHREINSLGMARSTVVVDSRDITTQKSGDTVQAILDGTLTAAHFRTELGDVITGRQPGRSTDNEITMYNSVGIALQDLAIARLLIERANKSGKGRLIDLNR